MKKPKKLPHKFRKFNEQFFDAERGVIVTIHAPAYSTAQYHEDQKRAVEEFNKEEVKMTNKAVLSEMKITKNNIGCEIYLRYQGDANIFEKRIIKFTDDAVQEVIRSTPFVIDLSEEK